MAETTIEEIRRRYASEPPWNADACYQAFKDIDFLLAEVVRLKAESDDLVAANIRQLLDEMKSRLLSEEAEQFEKLLMTGAQVWGEEIVRAIQRSDEDEALLEAFRGDPRFQKK